MAAQTQTQPPVGPPRADQLLATELATIADAVQAGDERFGLTPFLVEQVLAEPRVARIPRAAP